MADNRCVKVYRVLDSSNPNGAVMNQQDFETIMQTRDRHSTELRLTGTVQGFNEQNGHGDTFPDGGPKVSGYLLEALIPGPWTRVEGDAAEACETRRRE